MTKIRLALVLAICMSTLGLAACGGNSVAGTPMPDWARTAHEEANDKGP